jgi:hypothetical protein
MKKKLLLLSFIMCLALSIVLVPKTNAASNITNPTDLWYTRDAKIPPSLYYYLLNDTGIAFYIYTDIKID